ncbi:hypothetical protein IHE44_0002288, partial [Lamprotornis superbus]
AGCGGAVAARPRLRRGPEAVLTGRRAAALRATAAAPGPEEPGRAEPGFAEPGFAEPGPARGRSRSFNHLPMASDFFEEETAPKREVVRSTVGKMNPAVHPILYLPEYGKRPNELSEMVSGMLKNGGTELEGRSYFKAGFFIFLNAARHWKDPVFHGEVQCSVDPMDPVFHGEVQCSVDSMDPVFHGEVQCSMDSMDPVFHGGVQCSMDPKAPMFHGGVYYCLRMNCQETEIHIHDLAQHTQTNNTTEQAALQRMCEKRSHLSPKVAGVSSLSIMLVYSRRRDLNPTKVLTEDVQDQNFLPGKLLVQVYYRQACQ